jgi:hypothetical protein
MPNQGDDDCNHIRQVRFRRFTSAAAIRLARRARQPARANVLPLAGHCANDGDAIEKAKIFAMGVSLDRPAADPDRYAAVLNEAGDEIFRVPVYSRPIKPIKVSRRPSLGRR